MSNNRALHPGMAAVFSFIFCGLGQIYNGQINKGLLIVFAASVSLFIFLFGSIIIGGWLLGKIVSLSLLTVGSGLFAAGLLLISVLSLYSIYDAYRVASGS